MKGQGKRKKNGNGKGPQHNPGNQGGGKRKADGSLEFVANASSQGNSQRRKGRPPPRASGSGPTLEQLLNEHCPRHDSREKPATHLWNDCAIMKAFKNYNGPGGGSNSNPQNGQGGFNQQSGQGLQQQQGVIRPTQSSLAVDSIMCSPPVCANGIRSFTRELFMLLSRRFHATYDGLSSL